MSYPSADKLAEMVDSRFSLVVLAAKRAKQLKEGAPKLIETNSTNPLTIALEEIAAGKVKYDVPSTDVPPPKAAEPELFSVSELLLPNVEDSAATEETPLEIEAEVEPSDLLPILEDEGLEPEAEAVVDLVDEVSIDEIAVEAEEAEEEPVAEAIVEVKPKRLRKKAEVAETAAEPVAEETIIEAKPKRPRKKAEVVDTAEESMAEAAPEAVIEEKPKRSRKKTEPVEA